VVDLTPITPSKALLVGHGLAVTWKSWQHLENMHVVSMVCSTVAF